MVDEDYPEDDDALPEAAAESGRVRPRKTADAFRTISEVADELHVPQHVLRFWETKFPQVRPLKRGGGRRYYRPEDVLLLRRVADLLYTQGYTIKGVQRLLREGGGALHENIPPASQEERLAAEAEAVRGVVPVPAPVTAKKAAAPQIIPQLPMPGLLPEPEAEPEIEPLEVLPHAPAPAPVSDASVTQENQRLRALLSETLAALEELRGLLG
nr:MerR family transcriptional regulator [Acidocella aquatica]